MNTRPGIRLVIAATAAMTILLGGCGKAPEATATTPAASAAAGHTADIDVTSNVKTALLQDAGLKGFDIAVETSNGDVRLVGVLDNQAQIDAAIKLARAADGAHTIHDELTVKK
jgi:osmotically-inducible protein OsmY